MANTLAIVRPGTVGFINRLGPPQLLAHYVAGPLVPNAWAE